MTKEVMTANKAVAEAVRLAKPQVIPVYPITPQTTISEYLAQYLNTVQLVHLLERVVLE